MNKEYEMIKWAQEYDSFKQNIIVCINKKE